MTNTTPVNEEEIICEFIGGPCDTLLKVMRGPSCYNNTDTLIRAYWVGEWYISPGRKIEV